INCRCNKGAGFKRAPTHFPHFFKCVMESCLSGEQLGLSLKEQTVLLLFLDHCFNSLEVDLIREQVQKLVSLPMWMCLLPVNITASHTFHVPCHHCFNVCFVVHVALGSVSMEKVHYCERFMIEVSCHSSISSAAFFLLDMLKFYTGFEISDQTGNALTQKEMTTLHYDRITSLQRAAFANFPELSDFALSNVAAVDTRDPNTLHRVSAYLCLLPELPDGEDTPYHKEFLLELLVSRHERRISQIEQLNQMPLNLTEKIIRDQNIVPTEYYSGEGGHQLSLHDYLLRNFNLFRLESTYEIRQDIEDIVLRMKPWFSEYGGVVFGGWARMAQTIASFSIVEVAKPNSGENWPAEADLAVNRNTTTAQIVIVPTGLRKHDVCFLITVRPNLLYGTRFDRRQPFVDQAWLVYVRGCEVQSMLDDKGRVREEGPDPKPKLKGDTRTFRVWLDPNQYQQDMTNSIQNGAEDPYETFNIIMRRKPKKIKKAVLETIRNLMNTECVVPDWLHDIILGYGDPGSAHYSKMPNQIPSLDFNDTFLSIEHLKSCFPNHMVKVTEEDPARQVPPFRLKKRKANEEEKQDEEDLMLVVEPHVTHTHTHTNTLNSSTQVAWAKSILIYCRLIRTFFFLISLEYELCCRLVCVRYGRVNYVPSRRLELLREVARLQESLDVPGDVSYTCETVMSLWEEYMSKAKPKPGREVTTEDVASHFPFHKYFSNAPQPVFKGQSYQEDMDITEGCYRHIRKIFTQLEVGLKLLFDVNKIFSALMFSRHDLVELGFKVSNPEDGYRRLQSTQTLHYDHHQLPPVIKNMAFQKYSNMEQSLFTRFVRLGVPTVDLDAQGRAQARSVHLSDWKDAFICTHVKSLLNLAEAEYAVALYMYAERINVLTTYNGQKHGIRDVINQRCASNSSFGQPSKVTTVDRFQGQQNDYIILSLVHTKAVGRLRDVRHLVVAMSRARLGLYVFARVSFFQNCYELTPAFSQLTARPLQLHIRPHQYYSSTEERSRRDQVVKDMPEMANLVYNMYMHMIQSMQQYRQVSVLMFAEMSNQDEEEQEQDHTKMPEHPGRDSDSDEDGEA
uniref:Aquarius intron-binding spliceosomal factor n=1 Tax=Sinocyclocheilus rhinocerous TaxID=307959 RepID=A0A673HDG2_9TELE